MTLLHRPSRSVYRLYTEEEFLAGADWAGEAVAEEWLGGVATEEWTRDTGAAADLSPWGRVGGVGARGSDSRTWGRVAGIAALTGALAVAVGVVVVSASRSPAGRRSALGPSPDNRSLSAAPSPPALSRLSGRDWRRHRRAARRPAVPRRTARRGGVREIAQASPPAVAVTAEAPPPTDVPVHVVDTASSAVPVSEARSEFGFER